MNKNRVVWHEGLFLRPQHLQQQELFLQHWIEGRCQGVRAFSWGFTRLKLDDKLLSLGKVAIQRAKGVFADGTPFDIPSNTPAPLPYEVAVDLKDSLLYLVVPLTQPNALMMVNADENVKKSSLVRYRIKDLQVKDLHSEQIESEADLQVGELNLSVLPETEKLDAYSVIPIARVIERDKDGAIKLDDNYIPVVMHCDAASQLSGYITETQGLLDHRGDALANRLAAPGVGGVADIAEFLLLQLVNRYEPIFRHLKSSKGIYPEELFRALVALAGELATFTREERRPLKLSDYIHSQQQGSFEPVMDEIRRALSAVLEQKAIGIAIKEHKYGIWVATFNDKGLLDTAQIVLAVRADTSTEKIRSKFPKQTTISTVEKIRELVNSHIHGIEITPMAVAPRQIPYHSGYSYFEINTQHEFWKQMSSSGGLAIHVGAKLDNLEMELWAIRE